MRIYFLHHSAVCVTSGKTLLIFDYFMHKKDKRIKDGYISFDVINAFERVYVFVSHSHHDHFNPRIFDWAFPHVTYVLDSTVTHKKMPQNAVILRPGETYSDETLFVREFGSTDCGGSFYVDLQGTSYFHAGDLNDWHWKDEGNERYTRVMSRLFNREMAYIQAHVAHIDYAFFPVDARLGTDYDAGAKKFIETMKPDVLIPIHFQSFADTEDFAISTAGSMTKVLSVKHIGERLV